MTLDLDRLEALAKVATPGPWRGDRIDGTVKYDIVAGDYPNGEYTVVCHGDNGNASDGGYGFTSAENEDYALAANPSTILALIAEVRALREDAAMFRLLTSTCYALDANSFDASNQPGTIRITLKHKTRTYPELEMKIIDFLLGYKARVEAATKEPT